MEIFGTMFLLEAILLNEKINLSVTKPFQKHFCDLCVINLTAAHNYDMIDTK